MIYLKTHKKRPTKNYAMKPKRYEGKDEDDLLKHIDEDPDKFQGWEGPIEANLRSVRLLILSYQKTAPRIFTAVL